MRPNVDFPAPGGPTISACPHTRSASITSARMGCGFPLKPGGVTGCAASALPVATAACAASVAASGAGAVTVTGSSTARVHAADVSPSSATDGVTKFATPQRWHLRLTVWSAGWGGTWIGRAHAPHGMRKYRPVGFNVASTISDFTFDPFKCRTLEKRREQRVGQRSRDTGRGADRERRGHPLNERIGETN